MIYPYCQNCGHNIGGLHTCPFCGWSEQMATLIAQAVAAEREACALFEPPYNEDEGAESTYIDGYLRGWEDYRAAIRARGE